MSLDDNVSNLLWIDSVHASMIRIYDGVSVGK